MCDMTHSYVGHDSFICVTWLIHMCDMTHSYVWHSSFICVTWLIHMWDMTHSYVWQSRRVHVCDTAEVIHVCLSHLWMCLVTYVNESWHAHCSCVTKQPCARSIMTHSRACPKRVMTSHDSPWHVFSTRPISLWTGRLVTRINPSWVTSHMNQSLHTRMVVSYMKHKCRVIHCVQRRVSYIVSCHTLWTKTSHTGCLQHATL